MVEDVSAEDAQVGRGRVGEGSEFAAHVGHATAIASEYDNGSHNNGFAYAADPLKGRTL